MQTLRHQVEAIRELLETAQNEPRDINIDILIVQLKTVLEGNWSDWTLNERANLTELTLRTFLLGMQHWDSYYLNDQDIDCILDLLVSDDKIVETLDIDTDIATALAFVCLAAVAYKEAGERKSSNYGVAKTLAHWTGDSSFDDEQGLTVEKLTNLLYGRAAYALYRSDVSTDDRMPALLCRQRVPVLDLGKSKTMSSEIKPGTIEVSLPNNIEPADNQSY